MITKKAELDALPHLGEDVEELSLLLPSWQIMALAEVAEAEGLTVGQYMRRLLNQTLESFPLN